MLQKQFYSQSPYSNNVPLMAGPAISYGANLSFSPFTTTSQKRSFNIPPPPPPSISNMFSIPPPPPGNFYGSGLPPPPPPSISNMFSIPPPPPPPSYSVVPQSNLFSAPQIQSSSTTSFRGPPVPPQAPQSFAPR